MNYDAVLIAGPTASGKSQVALAVAEAQNGNIVNADAMQIYREMRVLTARPSDDEMRRVPHYLYGHVSVREAYSVGRYQADATRTLEESRRADRVAIFTGGTGLYFAALTEGLAGIPPIPATVRTAVRSRFVDVDGPAIHAALAESDPEMAKALRATDRQRLIRAFEVLEATGRSLAYWQRSATQPVLHGRRVAKFFLDVPREILRQRIQTRFRAMMISGVIEEVAALECLDLSLPATKTLGLRELLAVRAGRMSETEAVARAVTQTGQYAKRQVTWARQRMADWLWIQAPEPNKIVAEILRNVI